MTELVFVVFQLLQHGEKDVQVDTVEGKHICTKFKPSFQTSEISLES